jgi:hypothetical protein
MVTQNLVGDVEVLVISLPGKKKVPECHSGLRPSEKELPEWHSGVFRHKNTPDFNIIHHLLLSPLFGYVRNSTCISCLSLPN